jgi:hypothetical protein
MKKQLLVLLAFCISILGYAQTFYELDNNNNTLEYDIISATEVAVKDYISGGTDIDIPSTVDNPNDGITYNVTSIGILAFLNNGLTSVIIPNSVTSINTGAFQGNSLTSITIPDGVTLLGNNAFFNNPITSLTIPNSVITIGNNAFQSNPIQNLSIGNSVTTIGSNAFLGSSITNLTIPSSVTSIGSGAFAGSALACIVSESTTPPAINTVVGSPADTFSSIRGNIDLSIPSGTASAYAAASWTGFNSVAEGLTGTFIVDNITYQINPTPFNEVTVTDYNTAGGTVVNIPETVISACTTFTVTDIFDFAFQSKNLMSLTLPNSLINIGENAFAFNDLPSITIPDSVETIGDGAFAQNNNMTSVTIGSGVTNIGEYSFRFNALTSVTIPDNVITIGQLAFSSNSIINLDLGNGVETIGSQAFRYNNGIQSLTIPASVTSIGDSAFLNITSLTDVYAEGNTPATITTSVTATDSFAADRSTIHLHIPAGTMGAYVTDPGALWTGFNPVTEDALLSTANYEALNSNVKVINTENSIQVISNNAQLQQYEIYALTGAKIATGNTTHIKTNAFANGIYILKLDFDKGTVVKKIAIN